jgi:uncharacterized hydrophobic protein (TIGR00271 family)
LKFREIGSLFSLSVDKASDDAIDEALRAGVAMRGTNLWVLIFAIFIASIGLNVNSTAVIIGAMLISPLMGPIMGIGYGIGIYDFALVRTGLKNLGIAVFISLCTSVLYFLISPLTQAQSELLARTTPTIWDVLIALFGGLAGIVGATRKEKSNVIPGVAIATALMPPLCTAGYGLANGNWAFFGGAFYLFTINSVFIAFASSLVVHLSHVREKHFVDEKVASRVKKLVLLVALLTVVPSVWLAYNLVRDEVFKSRANQFVEQMIASKHTYVTQSQIDPANKMIEITVIGEFLSSAKLAAIAERLPAAGLSEAKLEVHQQADQQRIDVTSLKSGLLSDLYNKSQQALEAKEQQIRQLQTALNQRSSDQEQLKAIPEELHALFPHISGVWLAQAIHWSMEGRAGNESELVLNIRITDQLSADERARLESWLATRMKTKNVKLVVETDFPPVVSRSKGKAVRK